MNFITEDYLQNQVVELASISKRRIYIATAYCKIKPFFEHVVKVTSEVSDKKLFVRWQLEDLVRGSSDLAVYKIATDFGWKVYLNQRLHAKLYGFDDKVIIGSANLTQSGIERGGNIECAGMCEFDKGISDWFSTLRQKSVLIDDALFQSIEIEVQLKALAYTESEENLFQYSQGVKDLLINRKPYGLFTADFLWTQYPDEILNATVLTDEHHHDIRLLGMEIRPNKSDLKEAFLQCPPFQWLNQVLSDNESKHFGYLSHQLHNDLFDDPAPYRKTVKDLVRNLLKWTEAFANDLIIQERTAHSTIIRKK